jgi:inosose dehydratase
MRVAGAPISWGVSEVPGWGELLDADTVLAEMAELGLRATELGPPGYLSADPGGLAALLATYELRLVGGFLAVVLHDDVLAESTVRAADAAAALLAAAGGEVLVLAAATGLDGYDQRPDLTREQRHRVSDAAGRVAARAAGYGLRTTLHPHVGTHVEGADEVERFLADSDLPLCLDTGHLMVGGVDPVAVARDYPDRIGHVHLKDVRADLVERVRRGEVGYAEAVRNGMYVPLGDGDVDVEQIVRCLEAAGYRGWYVLEQDTVLAEVADPVAAARPKQDTSRSLAHLHTLVGRLPAGQPKEKQ